MVRGDRVEASPKILASLSKKITPESEVIVKPPSFQPFENIPVPSDIAVGLSVILLNHPTEHDLVFLCWYRWARLVHHEIS